MGVEGIHRGFEQRREELRVQGAGAPAALLRHVLPDVLPEVAEPRHVGGKHVVGDRDPRQLHDAGLDGVHQGEVADRPGEERPFGVARTAQEERGRRKVEDDGDGDRLLHRLDAGDPDTGRLGVLLRFLGIVALEVRFSRTPAFSR